MPRRRRGASCGCGRGAMPSAGLRCAFCLHSPKDTVAGALAFAAVSAIITNALFLQTGSHPSPLFGSVGGDAGGGIGEPQPIAASPPRGSHDLSPSKPAESKAAEPKLSRTETCGAKTCRAEERRPAGQSGQGDQRAARHLPVSPGRRRRFRFTRPETIVSCGLATRGGGAARAHGIWLWPAETDRHGRFGHPGSHPEIRARAKVPVTGQVSDRLVRELTAMIGHPID